MIRIQLINGRWTMRSPYDPRILTIAKEHRGRWNPETRVWWWASELDAHDAVEDLRELGFDVLIIDTKPPPPPPRPGRDNNPWTAVLTSLPDPLRKPVYRAVVRVLHPDQGGDLACMQQLTAAYAQTEPRP